MSPMPYRGWSPQRWRTVREALKSWARTKRLIVILLVMTACTVVIMHVARTEVSPIVAVVQHHLQRRVVHHHLLRLPHRVVHHLLCRLIRA